MNGYDKNIQKKIDDANCMKCKHIYFLADDRRELQRCNVASMKIKPPADKDLFKYILENQPKDINFCEYFCKI